ncbi:hypothetical protein B0H16DRAFT_751248 [Mycena metata]|uniref:Uncharacterized protein n=1 Tax=Mycena metata TaxID=1033252 RepID=A0AAD7GPQ4_9AGAR|nr:hypothetical protein B0H16DRAFT_751248 [Mycena metata]
MLAFYSLSSSTRIFRLMYIFCHAVSLRISTTLHAFPSGDSFSNTRGMNGVPLIAPYDDGWSSGASSRFPSTRFIGQSVGEDDGEHRAIGSVFTRRKPYSRPQKTVNHLSPRR